MAFNFRRWISFDILCKWMKPRHDALLCKYELWIVISWNLGPNCITQADSIALKQEYEVVWEGRVGTTHRTLCKYSQVEFTFFIDILCDVSSNPALHESEIFKVIQIQLNNKGSTFEKKGAPYTGIEQKYHSPTTNWLSWMMTFAQQVRGTFYFPGICHFQTQWTVQGKYQSTNCNRARLLPLQL